MNRPRDFRPAADSPPGRVSRDPSPIWTVQREPRIERWQRQRLPSGRKTPFIGERTERRPFPGNPHPNHSRRTGAPLADRRERRRDQSLVEGGPSGMVVEGAEAQPTHPMGPTSHYGKWDRSPTTEHSSYAETSGKPEPPELPGEGTATLAAATITPPPPDPAGPARLGPSLRPTPDCPDRGRRGSRFRGRNRYREVSGHRREMSSRPPPRPPPLRAPAFAASSAEVRRGNLGNRPTPAAFQSGKTTQFLRPERPIANRGRAAPSSDGMRPDRRRPGASPLPIPWSGARQGSDPGDRARRRSAPHTVAVSIRPEAAPPWHPARPEGFPP